MGITIDNLPPPVEQALLARAAAEHKSVECVTLDAIARGLGVDAPPSLALPRDVSFLWADGPLEPAVLRALDDQRRIDPEMWQ